MWKPKSGENHGGNNSTKIHYDMSEYKMISKVSQTRSIQREMKILNRQEDQTNKNSHNFHSRKSGIEEAKFDLQMPNKWP